MTANVSPVIQARSLIKTFGTGEAQVKAVNRVDLDIAKGELALIMGPSGSGKTTLLSMLGALLRPDGGEIIINGQAMGRFNSRQLAHFRAHRIGFIFQAFNLLSALTVRDNILFPARFGEGLTPLVRTRADQLMARLGLEHRAHALPAMLSGGEKQRVAIARALINDPSIILADEPTGNLDSARGQEVMMILHDITRDEGKSVLIVTHDPRVEDVADRVLWLEDGALKDRRPNLHQWMVDPVCGMKVDRENATLSYRYQRIHYAFCSEACLERFKREPTAYIQSEGRTAQ